MQNQLTQEEIYNILYPEDLEIIELQRQQRIEEKTDKSAGTETVISTENNKVINKSTVQEDAKNYNSSLTNEVLDRKEESSSTETFLVDYWQYYDDTFDSEEDYHRQMTAESLEYQMEKEEEYLHELEKDDKISDGENDTFDEEYDWEAMMGPGYWDSNGGSPQWIPEN